MLSLPFRFGDATADAAAFAAFVFALVFEVEFESNASNGFRLMAVDLRLGGSLLQVFAEIKKGMFYRVMDFAFNKGTTSSIVKVLISNSTRQKISRWTTPARCDIFHPLRHRKFLDARYKIVKTKKL